LVYKGKVLIAHGRNIKRESVKYPPYRKRVWVERKRYYMEEKIKILMEKLGERFKGSTSGEDVTYIYLSDKVVEIPTIDFKDMSKEEIIAML
jgi:hypothetical protein